MSLPRLIHRAFRLLTFCALAVATTGVLAQNYHTSLRLPTASDPVGVSVADLNGDGLPDLVYGDASSTTQVERTYLAQANGGYAQGPALTLAPSVSALCRVLDATGDGRPDLLCPLYSTYHASLLLYPGNGDGSFGAAVVTDLPTSNNNYFLPALEPPGDINGDGKLDLLVIDSLNARAFVMLGNGKGGFVLASTVFNSQPAALIDLNHDGKLDLAYYSSVSPALGNGDGTFTNSFSSSLLSSFCIYRDMDGDGIPDAICSIHNNGNTVFSVYRGIGDGTFQTTPIYSATFGDSSNYYEGTGTFIAPMAVVDLNGDGILDVLGSAGDGLSVLIGQPGLKFTYPAHYATGYLALGTPSLNGPTASGGYVPLFVDMNGDGLPDIVCPGPNGLYISYSHRSGVIDAAPALEMSQLNGTAIVADFDGDHIPDIVASGEVNLKLARGKGDGSFAMPTSIPYLPGNTANYSSAQLLLGDFNGDGKPDILNIYPSSLASHSAFMLLGNGDGTFKGPITTPNNDSIFQSFSTQSVYDINGDGRSDLLTLDFASSSPTNLAILAALSNGDGSFRTVTTNVTTDIVPSANVSGSQPALADFNHDGKLDLVFATTKYLYILKGHGDGSFDTTGTLLPIPAYNGRASLYSIAVTTGDFDADGSQDCAVLMTLTNTGYNSSVPYATGVYVFYGNGDGTFSLPVAAGAFDHAYSNIVAADLDLDGRSDLILKTSGSLGGGYAVAIVHGFPNRSFGPEVNYYAGTGLSSLSIADLNLDGLPDLAFANADPNLTAGSVTLLLTSGSGDPSNSDSAMSLTSSLNPSLVGQAVTFTATLSGVTFGPPTGSIVFYDGNTALATVSLVPGTSVSAASFTTSTLTVGAHPINAVYVPTGRFNASSASLVQNVLLGWPTATTLACSPNPAYYDQTVAFAIAVATTAGPKNLIPTGSIALTDAGTLLATLPLGNGSGNYASLLSIGTHPITATYLPDTGFTGSSATCSEVVTRRPTTTTLVASPNPALYGTPVTLSAVTVATGQATIPAGTITFYDGSSLLGGATLDSAGHASLVTTTLTPGVHTLSATYGGAALLAPSTSAPFLETILAATITITVTSAPNPAVSFQPVQFTSRVSVQTNGVPPILTGTINFISSTSALPGGGSSAGLLLGSAQIDASGTATIITSALAAGTYPVTANFSGTAAYGSVPIVGSAVSSPLIQIVNPAPTYLTLAATPNPVGQGQPLTLLSTISDKPSTRLPDGPILFTEPSTGLTLGSITLTPGGTATLVTSVLTTGPHTLLASYPGNANFLPSAAQTILVNVLPATFTLAFTPPSLNVATGGSAPAPFTLVSLGSFADTMKLSCSNLPPEATCTLRSSTLPLSAGQTLVSAVEIGTSGGRNCSNYDAKASPPTASGGRFVFASLAPLALVLLGRKRLRRRGCRITLLLAALIATCAVTGCTTIIWFPTPPGTYTVLLTAEGATTGKAQTAALTLTVTPASSTATCRF